MYQHDHLALPGAHGAHFILCEATTLNPRVSSRATRGAAASALAALGACLASVRALVLSMSEGDIESLVDRRGASRYSQTTTQQQRGRPGRSPPKCTRSVIPVVDTSSSQVAARRPLPPRSAAGRPLIPKQGWASQLKSHRFGRVMVHLPSKSTVLLRFPLVSSPPPRLVPTALEAPALVTPRRTLLIPAILVGPRRAPIVPALLGRRAGRRRTPLALRQWTTAILLMLVVAAAIGRLLRRLPVPASAVRGLPVLLRRRGIVAAA